VSNGRAECAGTTSLTAMGKAEILLCDSFYGVGGVSRDNLVPIEEEGRKERHIL